MQKWAVWSAMFSASSWPFRAAVGAVSGFCKGDIGNILLQNGVVKPRLPLSFPPLLKACFGA